MSKKSRNVIFSESKTQHQRDGAFALGYSGLGSGESNPTPPGEARDNSNPPPQVSQEGSYYYRMQYLLFWTSRKTSIKKSRKPTKPADM